MRENDISGAVIDACYKTNIALGPELMESICDVVLGYELKKQGFTRNG